MRVIFNLMSFVFLTASSLVAENKTILNVSYDPTREFYEEYNQEFIKFWKEQNGGEITIKQSHGGSGKQARSVIDGLEADVVTLALAYDIDQISNRDILAKDWQKSFEHNSSPYTSTIVFLVRKGNPKGILDWEDLARDGVKVITPNPKTSGGARWNYLAAYGYSLKKNGQDEEKAKDLLKRIYKNVPVLDSGARGSTTTFASRKLGDVLITWENEAFLAKKEFEKEGFEIIAPSISILAEPPVAVVDRNVDKKGTREVSRAYLKYLYSETGQRLAAKHYYRPVNQAITKEFEQKFSKIELFRIDELFGSWQQAHDKHFKDGGTFDQIYNVS